MPELMQVLVARAPRRSRDPGAPRRAAPPPLLAPDQQIAGPDGRSRSPRRYASVTIGAGRLVPNAESGWHRPQAAPHGAAHLRARTAARPAERRAGVRRRSG